MRFQQWSSTISFLATFCHISTSQSENWAFLRMVQFFQSKLPFFYFKKISSKNKTNSFAFNLPVVIFYCTPLWNFDQILFHNITICLSVTIHHHYFFFVCLQFFLFRYVFFFFSFFRRPRPGPGSAMVSAMAERHHRYLTEPECKGSVEQRLKEGTPVRQNRPGIEPGPPETFPARNSAADWKIKCFFC